MNLHHKDLSLNSGENMKQISFVSDSNSLRAQVFSEIEKAILNGVLKPGESLIECKLSSELGVSRTPVREALRQLELEGLVKTVPNKGAIVIGISESDIEDIYSIRKVVEALAARWAAEKISDADIEKLSNVVELQEFYVSKNDLIQVWQLDTAFHEIIFNACGSRILMHTLTGFHHYIQKARELSLKTRGRPSLAVAEHKKILEALKNHNPDEAERLTSEHISRAQDNFNVNIKI